MPSSDGGEEGNASAGHSWIHRVRSLISRSREYDCKAEANVAAAATVTTSLYAIAPGCPFVGRGVDNADRKLKSS